jgi:hypothetical protein
MIVVGKGVVNGESCALAYLLIATPPVSKPQQEHQQRKCLTTILLMCFLSGLCPLRKRDTLGGTKARVVLKI